MWKDGTIFYSRLGLISLILFCTVVIIGTYDLSEPIVGFSCAHVRSLSSSFTLLISPFSMWRSLLPLYFVLQFVVPYDHFSSTWHASKEHIVPIIIMLVDSEAKKSKLWNYVLWHFPSRLYFSPTVRYLSTVWGAHSHGLLSPLRWRPWNLEYQKPT